MMLWVLKEWLKKVQICHFLKHLHKFLANRSNIRRIGVVSLWLLRVAIISTLIVRRRAQVVLIRGEQLLEVLSHIEAID